MDNEILEKVNEQVRKQFPYLKDVSPQVKSVREGIYELQYNASVQTANNQTLPIIVKVTTDDQGNIQKLTTSR